MVLNYERIMAYRPADIAVDYGARECILYALGIGIGMDPLDSGALKFVYERAGLEAFPTMAVVLGWPGRLTDPAFGVDERLVVAGDLKVVLHRPLAAHGRLISRPRVKEVIDKGPGNAAIILNTRDLVGADGAAVATVDSSTFDNYVNGHTGVSVAGHGADELRVLRKAVEDNRLRFAWFEKLAPFTVEGDVVWQCTFVGDMQRHLLARRDDDLIRLDVEIGQL